MAEPDDEGQRDDAQPKPDAVAVVADDKARLRAELKSTLAELAGLQVEIERLASCKHPPESAEGRVCRECGAEVW
jgi:hypothetical protein